MIIEIPQYCLRAYALFFLKHGSREPFKQSELDWIVSQSMKKKIFSILLRAGWIMKKSRDLYICMEPDKAIRGILEFKVLEVIKGAKKPYAFANLSAIEIWSDYSYVQRGIEKSPYYIKILKKDINYWKTFFNRWRIPHYINQGSTIGEYVIFIPSHVINSITKYGLNVEPLNKVMKVAKENELYSYAYHYMREKYGVASA